jgi:hypothetical protein
MLAGLLALAGAADSRSALGQGWGNDPPQNFHPRHRHAGPSATPPAYGNAPETKSSTRCCANTDPKTTNASSRNLTAAQNARLEISSRAFTRLTTNQLTTRCCDDPEQPPNLTSMSQGLELKLGTRKL